MNDMATVEYLLRQYAAAEARKRQSIFDKEKRSFFEGVMAATRTIINQRFGMDIIKVGGNRFYAYNSVCSIVVMKQ